MYTGYIRSYFNYYTYVVHAAELLQQSVATTSGSIVSQSRRDAIPTWSHHRQWTLRSSSAVSGGKKASVRARERIARRTSEPRGKTMLMDVWCRHWHRWCGNETRHQTLNSDHVTRASCVAPIRLPGPVWSIACTFRTWDVIVTFYVLAGPTKKVSESLFCEEQ